MLLTCQPGFEREAGAEASAAHLGSVDTSGAGWIRIRRVSSDPLPELCFAHRVLFDPAEITGDSVNGLAARLCDWFMGSLRGEKIEGAWPCIWQAPGEIPGLGRRMSAVETEFAALLRKRLSRVAKLATPELPRGSGPSRGLFVLAADFGRLLVARSVWLGGQRRMADDSAAPSRSYLKTEEAFAVLGREPVPGETVADLGAAPGGWSYSAAKRGARVVAVDNGPLKGGALDNPLIEHRREDAFRFRPEPGSRFDWLFCDMVEDPRRVLELVTQWTHGGWCRHLVVNLKFGHADALALLDSVRRPGYGPLADCATAKVRHLFHDREEFTIVGTLSK